MTMNCMQVFSVSEEMISLQRMRENHLKVLAVCLRMYQKTNNPYFYEYAKWIGNEALQIKKEIQSYE